MEIKLGDFGLATRL